MTRPCGYTIGGGRARARNRQGEDGMRLKLKISEAAREAAFWAALVVAATVSTLAVFVTVTIATGWLGLPGLLLGSLMGMGWLIACVVFIAVLCENS